MSVLDKIIDRKKVEVAEAKAKVSFGELEKQIQPGMVNLSLKQHLTALNKTGIIAEFKKGKKVVMVYPIDKWVLMMIEAGAEIRNLRDVKWHATEDGSEGKGTGRHIACFILDPNKKT